MEQDFHGDFQVNVMCFLLVSPVCYENFLNKVNLQRYVGNSFEPNIVAVAVGFFCFVFRDALTISTF